MSASASYSAVSPNTKSGYSPVAMREFIASSLSCPTSQVSSHSAPICSAMSCFISLSGSILSPSTEKKAVKCFISFLSDALKVTPAISPINNATVTAAETNLFIIPCFLPIFFCSVSAIKLHNSHYIP